MTTTTQFGNYLDALSAILRAAGATVAISGDAAEAVANIVELWYDGRHAEMPEATERSCKKLRELRRRQRALRKQRTATRIVDAELPLAADDATATERTSPTPSQPPPERSEPFQQYKVKIHAAVNLYVGANGIQEAIARGAALLPRNITHAEATLQKEVL